MPFFKKNGSVQTRQCTREFKIRVIRREARKVIGAGMRSRIADAFISQWIGISTDEADRMKDSGVRFMVNRWPLIELRMSRRDCKRWLRERYGREAPKSACKQCPYQESERLAKLKHLHPDEWADLCAFDESLRTPQMVARFRGEVFVHRSRQPLVQIDFAALGPDTRQGMLWTNECEGMCGV